MDWPKDKLTRFEVARLLGARTLQISLGAPILVKTEKTAHIEVAQEEFRNKMIPITVKRKMPSGEYIVINVRSAIENWIADHNGEI